MSHNLDELKAHQLREICEIFGVSSNKLKVEMIKNIKNASIENLTVSKLQEVLIKVGLAKSGVKKDLVARLDKWRNVPLNLSSTETTPKSPNPDVTHITSETEAHTPLSNPLPIPAPTMVPVQTSVAHDSASDDNLIKIIIRKLPKEPKDMLSKMSQCSAKDFALDKENKIYEKITNDNHLSKYIDSDNSDVDALYLLLLLDDNTIDMFYKKIMKDTPDSDRFSKIMGIMRNYTQLNKTSSGKKKISNTLKQSIWDKYMDGKSRGRCYCCDNNEISAFNFEAGHVVPESKGGATTVENLRPICSSCNKSMNNKDMIEYAKQNCPNSPLLKNKENF